MFGLLVIYCLKNVSLFTKRPRHPGTVGNSLLVTALHMWKRQILLSIAGGILFYMLLGTVYFMMRRGFVVLPLKERRAKKLSPFTRLSLQVEP